MARAPHYRVVLERGRVSVPLPVCGAHVTKVLADLDRANVRPSRLEHEDPAVPCSVCLSEEE